MSLILSVTREKKKETVGPMIGEEGKMVTANRKKIELFHFYLASVFSQKKKNSPYC